MRLSSLKSLVVALSLPSTSAALAHVVASGVPGMTFEHDVPVTCVRRGTTAPTMNS